MKSMNDMGFKKIFVGVTLFLLWSSSLKAGVIAGLADFKPEDRVLILAPHPDDESIGTGGIIQKALKAGAKIKVVLLTNGENNELSFIVYKKRPVLRPKELLTMGEVRWKESLAALTVLGLGQVDLVALGYPDYGTMDVFMNYWGPVKRPYRSMLSRQRKVPYENALTPGAPYVGESVLKDLKTVIQDFQPTKIFVSHPTDTNRDHRSLYLFLRVALWDLEGKISSPEVYPYIIHVVGWPKPRGYFPENELFVPPGLVASDILWKNVDLSSDLVQKKHDAILCYASQNKYAPKYLLTFARRNEIFGDYPPVPIVRQLASEVAWQRIVTGDEKVPAKTNGQPNEISSLDYARQGNNLLVRVSLKKAVEGDMRLNLFLFGYKSGTAFGDIPKINVVIGKDFFQVRDKNKNFPAKDVLYTVKDLEYIVCLPLSLLESPEYILTSVRTSLFGMPLDETAWRVLLIK